MNFYLKSKQMNITTIPLINNNLKRINKKYLLLNKVHNINNIENNITQEESKNDNFLNTNTQLNNTQTSRYELSNVLNSNESNSACNDNIRMSSPTFSKIRVVAINSDDSVKRILRENKARRKTIDNF